MLDVPKVARERQPISIILSLLQAFQKLSENGEIKQPLNVPPLTQTPQGGQNLFKPLREDLQTLK